MGRQTLEEQLEPLANDLANALAEEKKAKQRADEIKEQIRAIVGTHGDGDYAAGLQTVRVTVSRTVDAASIQRDFPADTHPYLYRISPDVRKVRAHLDEQQLERYLTAAGDLRIGLGR